MAKEVEKQTEPLQTENRQLKEKYASAIDRYNRLVSSYDEISFDKKRTEAALVEYKRGEQERFNAYVARTKWKDEVLAAVALMLARTDQLLRQAINAIIRFAKSKCSSFFFDEKASAIKTTMNNYSQTPDKHQSVGKWLILAAKEDGHLTEREQARVEKEVNEVAQGRYDRRLDMGCGMRL